MKQPDLFRTTVKEPAKQDRDRVLKQVSDNPWMPKALRALKFLSRRRDWTGEDIRNVLEQTVGRPHHHNAWGALISAAIKKNLIKATGEYRAMEGPLSHARKTPVYRVPQ